MPKTYSSSARSRKKGTTRKRAKKRIVKIDLDKLAAQSQVDSLTRKLKEANDRIAILECDRSHYAGASQRLVRWLKKDQKDAAEISGITELEYAVNLFNMMRLEWVPRSAISINY